MTNRWNCLQSSEIIDGGSERRAGQRMNARCERSRLLENRRVIEAKLTHGPTHDTGTIELVSGQRYSIELEYYDDGAGAIMELNWMRSGKNAFDVIPQTKLYSA
jgi:hypothetical protein